jgi:hypothetical protein
MLVCVAVLSLFSGSLGPQTWLPWCYSMLAAIVLFALNGLYQHRSWWIKGGQETVYQEVEPAAMDKLPSSKLSMDHHHFGSSFQVGTQLQQLAVGSAPY